MTLKRKEPLLHVENIEKYYGNPGAVTKALDQVSFDVQAGEFISIMGASGSGKTTLLNCISTIDTVSSGHILLDGQDITTITEKNIAAFRRDYLGFVFQDFNLLDTFSLEDNIYLPLVLMGKHYDEMHNRLMPIADRLRISELLKKYPYEVSGGQKQRAAVARTLITRPKLVLADEPTGALDSKSTDELLDIFEDVNRMGQTIVMVTHSVKAASRAGRVMFIRDGEVFHQIYRGNSTNEELYQKISDTLTLLANRKTVAPVG